MDCTILQSAMGMVIAVMCAFAFLSAPILFWCAFVKIMNEWLRTD